ncbi:hypothetical protein [Nonomuraea sp. NPDC049480]|uniref:hypothetical protein n=1 Tax=Nonomuraea sp. NPDC049480 TaxID=3364353 RepID=UPI003795D235
MPRSLLRSLSHGALAVAAWAMYETLMPRALGGGRAPAYARRCWVAEALGVSPASAALVRQRRLCGRAASAALQLPSTAREWTEQLAALARQLKDGGKLADEHWHLGYLYGTLADAVIALGNAHPGGLDRLQPRRR